MQGCGRPLNAADLFAVGTCPHCSVGITDLIVWTKGGLKKTEYLPFIGLLGALVGLALDTPSNTPPE